MKPETTREQTRIMDLRPYRIMCLICWLHKENKERLDGFQNIELFNALYKKPLQLIRLCCNVDAYYKYQNPGLNDNCFGGEWYNIKRDLDILQKIGLVPGDCAIAFNAVMSC